MPDALSKKTEAYVQCNSLNRRSYSKNGTIGLDGSIKAQCVKTDNGISDATDVDGRN